MSWNFWRGEVTGVAADIISELMHAQCNVNANEYILLVAFVHHRKNGSALSAGDQKIVVKG